jgi:hypothetical protein
LLFYDLKEAKALLDALAHEAKKQAISASGRIRFVERSA